MPLESNADKDYWEWLASNNDKFSFKKTWEFIRDKHQIAEWYEFIWKKSNCLKMTFCTFFVINNKLPTRDRISKWEKQISLHALYVKYLQNLASIYFLNVYILSIYGSSKI